MPIKPMIYPEKLSSTLAKVRLPMQNDSFSEFKRTLINYNILVFDPAPFLANAKHRGIPVYLQTDTHLSSQGVLIVAHELGQFIQYHVKLPAYPKPLFTTSEITIARWGDIAVL